jgi:hypothetical protein
MLKKTPFGKAILEKFEIIVTNVALIKKYKVIRYMVRNISQWGRRYLGLGII